MRATIKDVAKRAGVSPSTVSLVLNHHDAAISSRTRAIVKKAAQELNYRPNQLAVGLITKKTNVLGLIIPDNTNYFQAAYASQIERVARSHGYALIIGIANEAASRVIQYLYDFSDRGVDGIILIQSAFENAEDNENCRRAIQDMPIPIILTDRIYEKGNCDSVSIDDFWGGYLAVKHLLDLGHTRIGLITGPLYYSNTAFRLDGARKAYKEAGLTLDESMIFEGEYQISGGTKSLPYLLGKGITAIFAFNDMIAFGIYKELHAYNLKIPEDISIVGFDDIVFADIMQPPLTTVEYPIVSMAETLVPRLIARIRSTAPAACESIVFAPLLKARGSTRKL